MILPQLIAHGAAIRAGNRMLEIAPETVFRRAAFVVATMAAFRALLR